MADDALRPDSVQLAMAQTIALAEVSTRREHDLLGEADVPAGANLGIHRFRRRLWLQPSPISTRPCSRRLSSARALASRG